MTDRLVAVARALAADLLVPQAERVDVEGVPRLHVEAVKAARLLGVTAPAGYGGGGASAAVGRAVTEILAGACGATWFVATQHGTPLRTVLSSGNDAVRDRWLAPLASSEILSGVAVSHLRRPGGPVRATECDRGWRFDGRVDWMTSWGLADVFLLAGVTDDSADAEVIFAVLPACEQPGLAASGPMRLAAMQAAGNVSLTLDGLVVRPDDVALVQPLAEWRDADRLTTANVTPAAFGLLDTVVRRLAEVAARRGSPRGVALATAFGTERATLRTRAYALLDDVPAAECVDERLAIRGHVLELLNRAAVALVAAGAGTSMLRTNPAQRLAREALFHLVQAQTAPVREATLRRFADRTPAGPP